MEPQAKTQAVTLIQKVSFDMVISDVLPKLKKLRTIINRTSVLPILECFLISVEPDGTVEASATDLETYVTVGLRAELKNEIVEAAKFCVYAHEFVNMLSAISESDLISVEANAANVKISFENGKVSFDSIDAGGFPVEPETGPGNYFLETFGKLSSIWKRATRFISNDDLRPAMTGMLLTRHEGHLYTVATDAHRMMYKKTIDENAMDPVMLKGWRNTIIPKRALLFALNVIPAKSAAKIGESEHFVWMTDDDWFISSRKIDAKYPDWFYVIPKEMTREVVVLKSKLLALLRIFMLTMDAAAYQRGFALSFTTSKCRGVFLSGDSAHEIEYTIPVYSTEAFNADDTFQIGFNPKFLEDAMRDLDDSYIKIKLESSTKAAIFNEEILVMPLQLNY